MSGLDSLAHQTASVHRLQSNDTQVLTQVGLSFSRIKYVT